MLSLQTYCALNKTTSVSGLAGILNLGESSLRRILLAAELRRGFKASGGVLGPLGLPIGTASFQEDGGGSHSFRGGTLRTLGDGSGTAWDGMRRVRIDYIGFECLDESNEWSGSDEPYFIFAVIGPNTSSVKLIDPANDVDEGEKFNEQAGPIAIDFVPNELALSIIIREKDQGSAEEAKKLILAKAAEVAQVAAAIYSVAAEDADTGSGASNWISQVPAVGTVAGWLTGIAGMGDDNVGGRVHRLFTTIENTKLPTTPPVLGTFLGNQYNYVTDDIGSGPQGQYKVYFLITVYEMPAPPTPV